jgi:pimeloyl-ACP methyl ester carboxylesterase
MQRVVYAPQVAALWSFGAVTAAAYRRDRISRMDSRPFLGSLSPTFLLVGDGDGLTQPEPTKEICAGISGARLVVVPDCGHRHQLRSSLR